ncbi:MAG TPA: glutamate 5-kinase [Gammaproteobacteria bacterium]|nr:glutamate 5-kinase [Gammaproteobacteria bacterium]
MTANKNSHARETWIIKAGSSLITNHGQGLDQRFIANWANQVVALRKRNIHCLLVSSGAVAEGLKRLGTTERPRTLHELQAAAAVGQMGLIQSYEAQFQKHNIHTAQILLTHDDLANRQRYLNARNTLKSLLALNVIPVINENDSIAIDEIRFGDNDTLAALTANLMDANRLILLTDQNGMYSSDPNLDKSATLIKNRRAGDPELSKMASTGTPGKFGRGGMLTKVKAAERAARSGTLTIIAGGKVDNILLDIADDKENTGTWLTPDNEPLTARKQWLAGHLQIKGNLILDDGAINALTMKGKSLLPIGITHCNGDFKRGEAVACLDAAGNRLAQGLVNYNGDETRLIIGKSSEQIEQTLGYIDDTEIIHRDNLVLL